MENKITLSVDLKNNIADTHNLISQVQKNKGFQGEVGRDSFTKIQNFMKVIDELSGKNELTIDEFNVLSQTIKKVYGLLSTAASKIANLTPEIEKLQSGLEKKRAQRDAAQEKFDSAKTGLTEKNKAWAETMKDKQFYTMNKAGTAVTKQDVNAKYVATALANGNVDKIAMKDADGKPVYASEELIKQAQALAEQNATYQEAKKTLKSWNEALDSSTEKLKQAINKAAQDPKAKTGKGGEILNNVIGKQTDITKGLGKAKDSILDENLKKSNEALINNTKNLDKQSSSLGRAFKQFTIYNMAVRSVKSALREATNTVKELDKSLTEQAMVTGLTRKQTYSLIGSYQELALQCGATTKEIAGVATEYMKQGKSIKDSLVLTQAAVSAAKVARVSVGDSVNYLTTALNGFQLSADQAMKVSDKFAAVAASSASDYDELAIALSKVASQANLAGMSIDYTTALLTKGLETTREAPETMGTALKTIIARMREIKDYGETLEGDTDVNNVETQLSYVGIALKNEQGELRSTEEVLDDLGRKWDTLNANQQAAVAKALAGTRQQSRLIAMMTDYERVIELNEISQRSAGATAAQAGTYLEGMEAAMNKIQVAWEKIVSTLVDSEFIISIFQGIGNILNTVGAFLNNTPAQIALYTTLGMIGLNVLNQKIASYRLAKLEKEETNKENIAKAESTKLAAKAKIDEQQAFIIKTQAGEADRQNLIIKKQQAVEEQKKTVEALKQQRIALENKQSAGTLTKEEEKRLFTTKMTLGKEEKKLKIAEEELDQAKKAADVAKEDIETAKKKIKEEEGIQEKAELTLQALGSMGGVIGAVQGAFSGASLVVGTMYSSIMGIVGSFKQVISYGKAALGIFKKQNLELIKQKGIAIKNAVANAAASVGMNPFWGWAAAIALLAVIGVAVGVAIHKNNEYQKSAEKAAENVNKLSNDIYKLSEKANALEALGDSFDKIDQKAIKTNKDLKEMDSLLDQAADKLNDDIGEKEDIGYGKGVSEKAYYESLQTPTQKRKFLEKIEKDSREKMREKQQEQMDIINGLSSSERKKFLDPNATDAKIIQAQDAIYAKNNTALYDHIDALKESGELTVDDARSIEQMSQQILEGLPIQEAWKLANEESGESLKQLVNTMKDLEITVDGNKINASEILNSDDYDLNAKVEAFEAIQASLIDLGQEGAEALKAFNEAYNQYEVFAQMSSDVLDFIDKSQLSIDKINELYGAWTTLQKAGVKISQEEYEDRFELMMESLAQTDGDIERTIEFVFSDKLAQFEKGSEEYIKAYNAFINAYGNLVSVGILNMGQNIDKLKNNINSFYETAQKWSTMSETDKSKFISDNADLFGDTYDEEGNLVSSGKDFLAALESGNYERIEAALMNNDVLQKKIEERRKEIDQELKIERAKIGSERNEAYIQELEEYQNYLSDTNNLFKASLKVRLEQENKQIEEYKKMLQKQKEAEEKSINDRKDAYSKYFEDIDKQESEQEYKEKSDLLISNISKLSSSQNADAQAKTADLRQQLEELNKERAKELREKAREAVMDNMDKHLEDISKKFDDLLNNNRELLAALQGTNGQVSEYGNFNESDKLIGNMINKKALSGATANEMQQYMQDLKGIFGPQYGQEFFDKFKFKEENGNLILNVNGKTVNLSEAEGQSIYEVVQTALQSIGYR